MWELGLIILVALILLGPKQLTETARVLGRLYRDVTKMASELRSSIDLDSITSTPSSSSSFDTRPSHKEPPQSSQDDMHKFTPPGEKSGPDFYAELLESSREDDQEKASEASEDRGKGQRSDDADKEPEGRKAGEDRRGKEEA